MGKLLVYQRVRIVKVLTGFVFFFVPYVWARPNKNVSYPIGPLFAISLSDFPGGHMLILQENRSISRF